MILILTLLLSTVIGGEIPFLVDVPDDEINQEVADNSLDYGVRTINSVDKSQHVVIDSIHDLTATETRMHMLTQVPYTRPVRVMSMTGEIFTIEDTFYKTAYRDVVVDTEYHFVVTLRVETFDEEDESWVEFNNQEDENLASGSCPEDVGDDDEFQNTEGSCFSRNRNKSSEDSSATTALLSPVHISVSVDAEGHKGLTRYWYPTQEKAEADTQTNTHREDKEFSYLCVNIWNYNYWSERQDVLVKEIERVQPDIIGFQEVRARKKSPHVDSRYQAEDLALALGGYQYVFQPAMGFKEGHHEFVQEGLALFSRYPIIETDYIQLSRDPSDGGDFHQRICLRALVDTPLGLVNVMTTHLSLSSDARNRTLPEIGQWATEFPHPSILVGDFNAELTDDNLLSPFGFYDAWLRVHGDSDLPQEETWTFNTWDRRSRIDYTFVRGLDTKTISIEGQDGVHIGKGYRGIAGVKDMKETMFPSDHMFLHASFGALQDEDQ